MFKKFEMKENPPFLIEKELIIYLEELNKIPLEHLRAWGIPSGIREDLAYLIYLDKRGQILENIQLLEITGEIEKFIESGRATIQSRDNLPRSFGETIKKIHTNRRYRKTMIHLYEEHYRRMKIRTQIEDEIKRRIERINEEIIS